MSTDLSFLTLTAISIGFVHAVLGPDHYLPFIMLARAQGWTRPKTVWVVLACGLGHVGSSIALGLGGIALGFAVTNLTGIESWRGELAAWLLIAFGFVYTLWAVGNLYRKKTHSHTHIHADGTVHSHTHTHQTDHMHVHAQPERKSVTPWVLFIIFVFGPCEPLIPLLIYPAAVHGYWAMALVALAFSAATILTMLTLILVGNWGLKNLFLGKLEKYSHAIAGSTIFLSGLGIHFLGL